MDKVVVFGGGTFNPIAAHLSLAAPAFGETARRLVPLFDKYDFLEAELVLTKMADSSSKIMTNADLAAHVEQMVKDKEVKIVIMNAAICDFEIDNPGDARLSSQQDYPVLLKGIQGKILSTIRRERPDIILAGFKTTHGASASIQLAKAAQSMHTSDLDIVLANDLETRNNIMLNRFLSVYRGQRHYLLEKMVEEVVSMYRANRWL